MAPPAPEGVRGGSRGPRAPPPPLQPGVGRRQAQVLGPAPTAPARARSPARASRPRPALRPRRWARPEARALASRTVPRGRREAPSSPRYGPSKAGHATRKPGHATRKRPTPPVFARPGPPPAGPGRPRRPRPPAALLCPLPRARGPKGRGTGGVPPLRTTWAQNQKANARRWGAGPPRNPGPAGHLGVYRPPATLRAYAPRSGGPGTPRAGPWARRRGEIEPRATLPESLAVGRRIHTYTAWDSMQPT